MTGQPQANDDLLWAASIGSLNRVRRALKDGADVNAQGQYGSALHLAVWADRRVSRIEILQFLLERGADPNVRDQDGCTPLHVVMLQLHRMPPEEAVAITRLLLKHGACPNAQGKYGATPLHLAVDADVVEVEVIRLLLDFGADVRLPNEGGRTAMDMVADPDIRVLLEAHTLEQRLGDVPARSQVLPEAVL